MSTSAYKKSVDEIILDLPRTEQVIVSRLRSLILECLPHAEEKNSDGVPFYRRNRLICYIWPPSIQWGPEKPNDKKVVVLGFNQGNLMANEDSVLLGEGRKQVYCLYIKSLQDINENQIRALLFEAGMIDEGFGKKKKR